MNEDEVRAILEGLSAGTMEPQAALQRLKGGPFRAGNLGFAQIDHHRRLRQGLGEVIFGENKTIEQILAIATEAGVGGAPVLITRLQPEKSAGLSVAFPTGRANAAARTFILHPPPPLAAGTGTPHVAIVAAGTSDLSVAEEAAEVCVAMGVPCERYYDVGVAGIHRLLQRVEALQAATALVVVAGMEGALPSVVAGLLGRPVFAVPTSVGYGASFGGVSALLAMLNSCAPGVSVVNIDNGFSAAFAACQVVRAVWAASAISP
ncbi:MAG: nickel pincer cofactor biosynthesis protein LarB [Verrucomicrobia bacterium]|nr:nickel pincer cofactor biosynthesis protein LarB [Verrucomicrobiota bacterium]